MEITIPKEGNKWNEVKNMFKLRDDSVLYKHISMHNCNAK